MNFTFHIVLDATGVVLRVHYESMKRDVSIFARWRKYDI